MEEKKQLITEYGVLSNEIKEANSQIEENNRLIFAYELQEKIMQKQLHLIGYTEHQNLILNTMSKQHKIFSVLPECFPPAKQYHQYKSQEKHCEFAQTCTIKYLKNANFLIKQNKDDHDCQEFIKAVFYASSLKNMIKN